MNIWMGAVADRHLYAQPLDYVSDSGTDPTAPSSNINSDDSDVFGLVKKATNYFDQRTKRDPGYWLKSRPFKLQVNGQGHNILHLPYPVQVVRQVKDGDILIAEAPHAVIPDTNGDPLLRVDARAIELDTYSGITLEVPSSTESEDTFDLTVKDANGVAREEHEDLTVDPRSKDYVRRRLHDESRFVSVVRKSTGDKPAEGEFVLDGGYDEYNVKKDGDSFLSLANGEFTDGISNIDVIGEVGSKLSTPRDVRQAVIRIADLMERDEIKEKEERYHHESRSGRSQAPGLTGSHWVDLILEDYRRGASDSYLDVR